jgi:hypothetical protein
VQLASQHILSGLSVPQFLNPVGSLVSGTEGLTGIALIAEACTTSRLSLYLDNPVTATTTFTLRAGSSLGAIADTAMVCTVSSGSNACTSTTAVSLAANSLVDVALVPSGALPLVENAVMTLVCK